MIFINTFVFMKKQDILENDIEWMVTFGKEGGKDKEMQL
jgi:hypothetical protein